MQDCYVRLESKVFDSYLCQRAADSLDIDAKKKAVHELKIRNVDLETQYNVGLIVGASGSGKTTLIKKLWGDDCLKTVLDADAPIIEQFPEAMSYDERARALSGVGLTSVPCWIRPVCTLSNGQRARAEAALLMTKDVDVSVMDEWTSVVDRTVAKVMSHCVQKHARKTKKRIVLASCHYDVVDWLNPDWIIDCNQGVYIDRRRLQRDFKRTEQLRFEVAEVDRSTWRYFSKYHYLSSRLPGGIIYTYGLFCGGNQVGFQCFANYTPIRTDKKHGASKRIFHSNRTVVHPDYAGFGCGLLMVNATSEHMMKIERAGVIMAKFSSTPMHKARQHSLCWRFLGTNRHMGKTPTGQIGRHTGFRKNIKTYRYEYLPDRLPDNITMA